MESTFTDPTPRRPPELPAAHVVGAVALVLGRAESRLTWGSFEHAAITQGLREHPVGPRLAEACRTLWRIMLEGDPQDRAPETLRDTLTRLGYLDPVLVRLRELARDDPDDAHALRSALDQTPDSGRAADLRLMIDAFHAYAAMFRDATDACIPVDELVDALISMVVPA